MSQSAKLLKRFPGKPKDFTWDEIVTLLSSLGYDVVPNDGSSRKFHNKLKDSVICMHEPHPKRVLKTYQIIEIPKTLKKSGS